ncbi:DUF3052 family protein [Bradyrhizobium tropiciagri]|uniref:DUF3052 family protein n=1 Tax=Bradyrhizobium tropiciagri TaxID=312253 RepID=UPI00067AF75F|nr:DUF3052 family protein [Bradyrhizobium tropiciagri]
MAGTSGKPIVQKLGLKPGFCIFVDGLSVPYSDIVGELPAELRIAKTARAPLDAVHLFATTAKGLSARLRRYREAIAPDGMIWVSWPKKSSGVATDLDDRAVREAGLAAGLVDIKVCAVDAIWSGLKFVIPVKERSKR